MLRLTSELLGFNSNDSIIQVKNNKTEIGVLADIDLEFDTPLLETVSLMATVNLGLTLPHIRCSKNDAPVAHDDIFTIQDTGVFILKPVENDIDGDGDQLTVDRIVQQPREGVVTVNSDGAVNFDTNGQFFGLSEGQTAQVTFTYQATDSKDLSNNATVTINVEGVGLHNDGSQSATVDASINTRQENEQQVSAKLTVDEFDNDGITSFDLQLSQSDLVGDTFNIALLADVSGSMGHDLQQIQKDALKNLNASIQKAGFTDKQIDFKLIPYASTAKTTGIYANEYDPGQELDKAIDTLQSSGGTNFESPLQAAIQYFNVQPSGDTNMIYFLSDGNDYSDFFEDEAAALNDMGVSISAIGIGSGANLTKLNVIDNTNGAERVNSGSELNASLLGNPIEGAEVTDFSMYLNGIDLGYEVNDLSQSGLGYTLNGDVTGLSSKLGDSNEIYVEFTFDDGTVMSTQDLEVIGVMPESYIA